MSQPKQCATPRRLASLYDNDDQSRTEYSRKFKPFAISDSLTACLSIDFPMLRPPNMLPCVDEPSIQAEFSLKCIDAPVPAEPWTPQCEHKTRKYATNVTDATTPKFFGKKREPTVTDVDSLSI